jgi:hypothetical protein
MREGASPFGSPPRLSSLRLLLMERPESGDWQVREPMPTLRPCTSLLPLDLDGIGKATDQIDPRGSGYESKGRLPPEQPCDDVTPHPACAARRPVSTPGRTRRYIEEEAGELALAEIASRRLPFPPVGTPASGRLYPLEGSSTRPDRHEPGAADESCG